VPRICIGTNLAELAVFAIVFLGRLAVAGCASPVEDWDDFLVVIKYCKPYIESALAKTFDSNLGELYEVSPGRLALKPGHSPQAQFAEVADSFRGNPLKTKILIGWCVLLNLEIQVAATLTDGELEGDFDEELDDERDEEITDLDLGSIASFYLAGTAWAVAFKVPVPQHCRGRLVDIPKDVRDWETALYDRHRLDTPLPVGVPGIGSSTQVSAFSISVLSWGDILVTQLGTRVGVFFDHFVESNTDLSEWIEADSLVDKLITQDVDGESRRYRVCQQKDYACFRLLPANKPELNGLKIFSQLPEGLKI
jgi:hypothetical protein